MVRLAASDGECVHVDVYQPNRTRVDVERCSAWLASFDENCIWTEDPETCVDWVEAGTNDCVHVDPWAPHNSRVDLQDCPSIQVGGDEGPRVPGDLDDLLP